MKKILATLVLCGLLIVMAGCEFGQIINDLSSIADSMSITDTTNTSSDTTTEEEDVVVNKMEMYNQAVEAQANIQFGVDQWTGYFDFAMTMVGVELFSAVDLMYFAIAEAWDTPYFDTIFGDIYTDLDVTHVGNVYTLTYDEEGVATTVVITGDLETSLKVEGYEDLVLTYLSERVILSNNYIAYQVYNVDGENRTLYQIYTDGIVGRISYNAISLSAPTSIYGASSISASFANTGDLIFVLTTGNITFTDNSSK